MSRKKCMKFVVVILVLEEILHHLGCINLVNNGINYLSTGAGVLNLQQCNPYKWPEINGQLCMVPGVRYKYNPYNWGNGPLLIVTGTWRIIPDSKWCKSTRPGVIPLPNDQSSLMNGDPILTTYKSLGAHPPSRAPLLVGICKFGNPHPFPHRRAGFANSERIGTWLNMRWMKYKP